MFDMVDMISYFLRVDTVYMLDMVDMIFSQVATRLPQEMCGKNYLTGGADAMLM